MNFGAQQAVSNAVDGSCLQRRPVLPCARAARPWQSTFQGAAGTRYVAHGTTYKPRDRDASIRFKRARWKSYEMMRVRPQR
jgi:hypothetical protein